ncbi:MAG: amino acid adenylation domain-containing protein [Paracoccaceae bacterium]
MTPSLLHDVVDYAAEMAQDDEAFVHLKDRLSFGDLSQKSAKLAAVLRDLGVQPGDRVGIYRSIGVESVIAAYGIMRAGAVYVPIDPDAPNARVLAILQDCAIDVLISEPSKRENLGVGKIDHSPLRAIVGIDHLEGFETFDWAQVESHLPQQTRPRIIADDPAYIIYSSGSTGVPKGIVHTHASASAYAHAAVKSYDLKPGDRACNHAPLHFDISTFGMFAAPLAQATTVIIPEVFKRFPAEVSALIEREELTHWYSAPFALSQLLSRGALDLRDLSSLRWIMFGGDVIAAQDLRGLAEHVPYAKFSNVFGPAEVNEVTHHIFDTPPSGNDPIPIGRVCSHVRTLIVDDKDHPVEPGKPGELLVRTPARMAGYWNQPKLTKNKTLTRSCDGELLEHYHRTGDIVYAGPDGLLFFQGRKDRQVKVRGYRVELEEIELAFLSHPAVEEGGAFVSENSETLLAAVTVSKNVTEVELANHCKSLLPGFAVPSRIFVRNSLPRTASGKVDRIEIARQALEWE